MPSHFTLRMQFGLDQDPACVTEQLFDLARIAPVDEVMVFFFAEELNDGHDPLSRIEQWIDHSRPYRTALKEAGIQISLNPWHSLLHADRDRKLKPGQEWQLMVAPDGRQANAVVCPLDPGWRSYYEESLRLYSREGFRIIWIDDDIRYHNHAPLEWGGCFCPLHVAEFNRRAGVAVTRQEIVAAATAPGHPHPWRGLWMDMWQETQLEMLARWRAIVEEGGARLGLMSSLPEAHAAEGRRWADWWSTFAGTGHPAHRPHFWGYGDVPGPALVTSIAVLDQNRSVQPPGVESGPEIECFPYGRWNKSFRQIGAQLALAHVLGSTELNISLYDFMGNRPDDEPERAAFLKSWRPACDWLADTFPMTLSPVGVGLPWSEDIGRRIPADGSRGWESLTCPSRGWASWLGAAGHAFTTRPSSTVNALAGPVVWSFDDDTLRGWLSRGLLLDGVAAGILVERGMGKLIGAGGCHYVTQANVLYSYERCLSGDYGLRAGAAISVNDKPYAERLVQAELDSSARVVSELRSPTGELVGHGVFLFHNSLGGRIAVVPWIADAEVLMNIQRAVQLTKLLGFVDPAGSHGAVAGGPWLIPQFLTDGKIWRGVVWNAGPDEVDRLVLTPPAGMSRIVSATHIASMGRMCEAHVRGNEIALDQPLHQWECVVVE